MRAARTFHRPPTRLVTTTEDRTTKEREPSLENRVARRGSNIPDAVADPVADAGASVLSHSLARPCILPHERALEDARCSARPDGHPINHNTSDDRPVSKARTRKPPDQTCGEIAHTVRQS